MWCIGTNYRPNSQGMILTILEKSQFYYDLCKRNPPSGPLNYGHPVLKDAKCGQQTFTSVYFNP